MEEKKPLPDNETLLAITTVLSKIPGFDAEQIKKVVINLLIMIDNDFYRAYFKNNYKQISKESVVKLVEFLKKKNLSSSEIKDIFLSAPCILLFSNDLDNIYVLFKGKIFKGYVLLNDGEYKAYRYINDQKLMLSPSFINYDYVIDGILNDLNRVDIQTYYNLNEKSNLKEKFTKLEKDTSIKNFYFKK